MILAEFWDHYLAVSLLPNEGKLRGRIGLSRVHAKAVQDGGGGCYVLTHLRTHRINYIIWTPRIRVMPGLEVSSWACNLACHVRQEWLALFKVLSGQKAECCLSQEQLHMAIQIRMMLRVSVCSLNGLPQPGMALTCLQTLLGQMTLLFCWGIWYDWGLWPAGPLKAPYLIL